ncbi:MAG: tRNA threonylcarbamoyladenosine biosynthesis protein TsaB [Myxococcota bacterium]|jgi:tRNA threonylcarbamoyladenosine biosynthesis protein TsaB
MVVVFDTCGPVIGVAAATAGAVAVRTERIARGAERRLVPWALEVCAELGGTFDDVVGVGAAHGPGAFTGLRVGLSAAAGLAFALGVPVWTADSLLHRRLTADSDGRVLVLLDARKSRVYAALYDGEVLLEGPADVAPGAAGAWSSDPFVATGEGAVVYAAVVEAAGGSVAARATDPGVGQLARGAWHAIAAGAGGAPESVSPVYIRAPDAKPPRRGRIR